MEESLFLIVLGFTGWQACFLAGLYWAINRKGLGGAVGWGVASGLFLVMAVLPFT